LPIIIYAETSVYGQAASGAPDHFRLPTLAFFERVRQGDFLLLISEVLEAELSHPNTPPDSKDLLAEMMSYYQWAYQITTPEVEVLAQEYIVQGVLKPQHLNDARHVAAATVAGVDVLASWDRGEIVKQVRIAGFNRVSALMGYNSINFLTPDQI
jgi:predicted nucleic acid-binding protein